MKAIRIIFLSLVLFFASGAFAQEAGYWRTDTFCLDTAIRYTVNATDANGQPPQSWAWSMPNATPDTFYSTTSPTTPYFQFAEAGSYRVILTLLFQNGDDTSLYADVVTLDPSPPSNTLGNDTTYCGAINLTLDARNSGSTYLWNTGAQTQAIQVNGPGNYSVDVKNRCYSGTFDIAIAQSSLPSVDLGPDGFVCGEAPKELYSGTAMHSYQWSNGETAPTITTGIAGTYSITVTTADGCVSFDEVILRDSCPPDLYVPTAFTPNRDGRNDTLTPYINGIGSLRFAVYDRWGEMMFETTELGKGWSGHFGGEPVMTGVYIWYITALDSNGNRINKKGVFVLYR